MSESDYHLGYTITDNIIVCGCARFTIVAGHAVRMEYSVKQQFEDNPTFFARYRHGGQPDPVTEIKVTNQNQLICIETPAFRLRYRNDKLPFYSGNLEVEIINDHDYLTWRFGELNKFNLGGTLPTLDGISQPQALPNGLIARDGWAVVDDTNGALLATNHDAPEKLENWFADRQVDSDYYDGYLFAYGTDYAAALRALATISGEFVLPRRSTLGIWYSRWHAYTADDYRAIIKEFDQHDCPLDILVMDMDWHTKPAEAPGFGWANMPGWTGWSWNKELIPDPAELLADCQTAGVKVVLNAHPHDGVRSHEDSYIDFMQQLGRDPSGENLPFRAGDRDYMRAYFSAVHAPHEDIGVDFWWVDWQQDSLIPYALGFNTIKHLPILNHAYYAFSQRNQRRGQGLSRWAGLGDHRHPIHFSGDATANWDMLAFEIDFTVSAANVGCFYWSHDIGGFYGKNRDGELYARWVQFGLLTASMRLHSTGDHLDRRPWTWEQDIFTSIRLSLKLRSRLIPVIYSAMQKSRIQSLPYLRPLYYDWPELEETYRYRYQFTIDGILLAAPVISPTDQRQTTSVWLPPGQWVGFFDQVTRNGIGSVEISSTLNSFPLLIKAGTPLPLYPENNRPSRYNGGEVEIRCYHGDGRQSGEFILYEDDGYSNEYLQNGLAKTRLVYCPQQDSATLQIHATEGSFSAMPEQVSWTIVLIGAPTVREILVDGQVIDLNTNMTTSDSSQTDSSKVILPDCQRNKNLEIVWRW